MKNLDIKYLDLSSLKLDTDNPRLSEFGISSKTKDEVVLKILWDEMAVNELLYSIVSNGFWEYEPLIVIKKNNDYVVVEGNRRLAAVKILHNETDISVPTHISEKVTKDLLKSTNKLPCIIVVSKKDSWKYIGFKHVNGPAKWGSYAKARYIAEIHNDYKVSIEDIAYQIGDTNKTAQKLYQGLMVLEQAKKLKVFDIDDIQAGRLYFSHLYTGVQREGIRDYLGLKPFESIDKNPVDKKKHKELGLFLQWLFGSKKNDQQAIIKSQNPDLKYLDSVLKSKDAIQALLANEPLSYAYELSRPTTELFEENLISSKRFLQKARAYLTTGYKGEESLLRSAGTIANLSDDLYEEMQKVYVSKNGHSKKKRITD